MWEITNLLAVLVSRSNNCQHAGEEQACEQHRKHGVEHNNQTELDCHIEIAKNQKGGCTACGNGSADDRTTNTVQCLSHTLYPGLLTRLVVGVGNVKTLFKTKRYLKKAFS